ncbi:hypothetical protein GCM10018785_38710 [Streptomyces longispororuber]|uniref:Uncharacterized protein n=1 Tax=Streptomyces longispororuber TaxID=68230 RepID=A0A918ZSF4_9ACTN|nr:hypothetical protein [Streptomyces longispororuber]GHE66192.1 hypothetical protein GCM10018785_38710 [Streptomyces longispororuber]
MNAELERFISIYLHLEEAYDTSGTLRPTLMAFGDPFINGVRTGLQEVLRERNVSVGDYERMTDIEFPDEETLYEYLQGMYEYLFGEGMKQPVPPE